MTPKRRLIICVFGVAAFSTLARGEPTRTDLTSANAASQAAITSVQARVEAKVVFNPARATASPSIPNNIEYIIEYARAGNKERHKEQGHLGVRDILLEDSKGGSSFQPKRGDRSPAQALISSKDDFTPYFVVWNLLLFKLPQCNKSFSQLLTDGELDSIKNINEKGRTVVQVLIHDPRGRYEAIVDPSLKSA